MKVTYLDHMGSDLTVVSAARVSFNKKSAHKYAAKFGGNVIQVKVTYERVH